jgi:hypothetical protein
MLFVSSVGASAKSKWGRKAPTHSFFWGAGDRIQGLSCYALYHWAPAFIIVWKHKCPMQRALEFPCKVRTVKATAVITEKGLSWLTGDCSCYKAGSAVFLNMTARMHPHFTCPWIAVLSPVCTWHTVGAQCVFVGRTLCRRITVTFVIWKWHETWK